MKISGIYKIQSVIKPERIYIGSFINIDQRWGLHLKDLRKNKHHSPKLQNHYNKYGESDFNFSILLGCDISDLIKTEQYFLDSYNPYFNISKNAGSPLGTHHKLSEETRAKMRKPKSKETIQKMINSKLGKKRKPFTKKACQNMSKGKMGNVSVNKGKHLSSATCEKMSKSHIGKIPWNKGKSFVYSEENLKKMADGRRKSMAAKKLLLQTTLN